MPPVKTSRLPSAAKGLVTARMAALFEGLNDSERAADCCTPTELDPFRLIREEDGLDLVLDVFFSLRAGDGNFFHDE